MALIFFIGFIVSLLVGQLGAIPLSPGAFIYFHDVMLVIFLFVYGLSWIQKKKMVAPKALAPIITFVIIGVISLLFNSYRFSSSEIIVSSLYLGRWVAYALLYIMLVQSLIRATTLLWGLYAFGTGLSLIGLVQYIWYPELRNLSYLGWDPYFYRLFSTLFDPNFVGGIIVLTLLLGYFFIRQYPKQKLVWVTQIANIVALYLTYSRSSYLAVGVAIAAFIIWKKQWKLFILLALLVGLVIVIPKPGGKTLLLTRMDSSVARVGNWKQTLSLISKAPILGYGFNTLRYVKNSGVNQQGDIISRAGAGIDSSLLFVLATTGVVGFAVFVWLIVSITNMVTGGKASSHLVETYVVSLLAIGVHSLFSNSLFYPWVMIWLWIETAAIEIK